MVGRNSSITRKRASIPTKGPSHSVGSAHKRPTTDSNFDGEDSANAVAPPSSSTNKERNGLCTLRFTLDFASDTLRGVIKQSKGCVYSPPTYFDAAPLLAWRLVLSHSDDDEEGGIGSPPSEGGDMLGLHLACHTCSTRSYGDGCAEDRRRHPEWHAEVKECELRICSQVESEADMAEVRFSKMFTDGSNHSWELPTAVGMDLLLTSGENYLKDDKLIIAASFTMGEVFIPSNSPSATTTSITTLFDPSHANNDVTFVVDDGRQVHANKGILAVYSPVFTAMFHSDMAERHMQEIPLKDVEHGELVELLLIIYPSQKPIDENNVEFVLKLADRFLMASLTDRCEEFLLSKGWYLNTHHWPLSKSLYIAQTYPSLTNYKDTCYAHLGAGELIKLRQETGYRLLNEKTRATIADRVKLEVPAENDSAWKICSKCGKQLPIHECASATSGVEVRTCYNCGQAGHLSYNCPNRRAN